MMVTGQAGTFASVTICESVVSTGVTLVALYGLNLGAESLFVGALAGAVTNAVGSLIALRGMVRLRFDRKWVADCLHVGGLSFLASLVERGQVTVERYALVHYVGISVLGIYSHSQQYLNLAKAGAKAVSNATWPVALEEARAEDNRFSRLGMAWPPAHLALALGGVFMATLGRDAIALLTHGKFTPAYVFATLWIVLVLLENSAKPAVAIVYARGLGVANQWVVILGGLLAAALMVPLIKWLGALGAVAGAYVSVLVYRVVIVLIARRAAAFPFQDGTSFVGTAVVLVTLGVAIEMGNDLSTRVGLLIVAASILVVFCKSARQSTVLALRAMFA
jgi:O-antigen/teichoic acid export membrane protein